MTAEVKNAVYGGRKGQPKGKNEKLLQKTKNGNQKFKPSGVAKTVARVLPLACANEHLLRTMDSLVAVQYYEKSKDAKQ